MVRKLKRIYVKPETHRQIKIKATAKNKNIMDFLDEEFLDNDFKKMFRIKM